MSNGQGMTRRAVLGAAASAALAAPAIAQGARVFTFAHDEPHDTGYGFMADTFNAKLKELSGGKFSIHEFPGAQLGQEPELAQKVRSGDIDFVINATANTATVVPESGVFSMHFVFKSERHLVNCVLDPTMNAAFIDMIARKTTGARSLGLMTLGFRKFYSKKEIKNVGDLHGVKVRVQATKTEDRFFGAYGAVPVHMPIGQVYTSLETGLVEVAENGADIYRAQKHYEVAPILSASDHEANNNHLWVSDKAWNSLSPEEQGWVRATADFARRAMIPKSLEYDKAAQAALQKLGVEVFEGVDRQSFIVIATPIQDEQANALGPDAVKLLELSRKVAV